MNNLIFDLDGTLLDTLDDLWASVNHALAQFSLPIRSKCEIRSFLGNGARNLIHQAIVENSSPDLEDHVFQTFKAHYLHHNADLTRPYPGIMEMLHECHQRGYKTAIVSNKPHAAVQQLHQRFFADVIDVAIGQQPDIRRKPAPDMVFATIQQLQSLKTTPFSLNTPLPIGGRAESELCLRRREIYLPKGVPKASGERPFYIGDSEVDIATARNAGLPCICVDWGFRDRHFLEEQGAEHIIHLPDELFLLI